MPEYAKSGAIVAASALGGSAIVTISPAEFAEGYRRACARFRDAANSENPPPAELFYPLFEALNWSVAVADNIEVTTGERLDDPVVEGLRFVRNCVHHAYAQALELRKVPTPQVVTPSGSGSRAVWPPLGYDWFWKPLSRLAWGGTNDRGKAEYEAHLEDRPSRHALDRLDELLGHVASV